jgi:hypothetical protein
MTTIGLSVVATIGLFLAQGFLLQLAVAITGEAAPKYGRAMRIALVASFLALLATTAFGFTIGWVFGEALTALISGLLWVCTATLVYRRSLGVSAFHALFVALLQSALWSALYSLTWYVLG